MAFVPPNLITKPVAFSPFSFKMDMADDDYSSNKNEGVDNLAAKLALEKSWDENLMGIVPKSPEMAAKAAAQSIEKAMESSCKIQLVDIGMSQYDISAGEEMYDETLAVKFCVELAKNLGKNIPILLKNGRSQRLMERVLKSRLESVSEDRNEAKEVSLSDD